MGNSFNGNHSSWGIGQKHSLNFNVLFHRGILNVYQVYVVGEAGIQLELKQAGISYIGGPVLLSSAWPHLSLLITLIWVTALECV
jgi:hypothetical protein